MHFLEEEGQLDPVYVDLELTLEEIYEGCTKVIPFDRKIITQDQLDYFDVKVFTIKIPPGIEAGKTFPMVKEGNRCYGKTPGDVIFVVKEKEHEQFQRKGANLEHTIEITHNDSVFGFQRKIPLLGSVPFYQLRVSRHYHSNTKVLEGYGMPFPYDSEKNGDLIVKLKIIDSGKRFEKKVNKKVQQIVIIWKYFQVLESSLSFRLLS